MSNIQDKPRSTIKRLPGDLAIWIFIYAELLVFGVFFIAYAVMRRNNLELFTLSQQNLNVTSGMINTLLLISGSYCVVRAVAAIHQDNKPGTANWLLAAITTGILFLLIKSAEFYIKYQQGITLETNTFYMFYLSLTAFHFLHVILGLIILTVVWIKVRKHCYSPDNPYGVETGAAYWHMVDLVWIVLFPLVYVLR